MLQTIGHYAPLGMIICLVLMFGVLIPWAFYDSYCKPVLPKEVTDELEESIKKLHETIEGHKLSKTKK